jgi:hypothetical protein
MPTRVTQTAKPVVTASSAGGNARVTQISKPVITVLNTGGSARVTQVSKVVIATVAALSGGNRDLLRGMI